MDVNVGKECDEICFYIVGGGRYDRLPIFEERAEGASIQYLARRDLSGEWLLGDSGQYR